MEVDSEPQFVMVSGAVSASVTLSLHPLVVLNVSEHFTRVKAQNGKPTPVYGAILGKQNGRQLEVCNSFEVVTELVSGNIIIDKDFLVQQEEQFKQVFPDFDRLGWYTTGGLPNFADLAVHKQFSDNESPIILKLDPQIKPSDEHLPVHVYESVLDLNQGELFNEIPFTLATEEAERIGIDHIARSSASSSADDSISVVSEHFTVQHNAIKMLHTRIKLVVEYLKAVQTGELDIDYEILRGAAGLCNKLPTVNKLVFDTDFYRQYNDVALTALLGTLTKGCNSLNQFINKFNQLHERHGSRRTKGLYC